ncbi:GNAT family N-acetyltransferase [Hyphomonas sp.]|jgi:acetyltransferase|uniref:GNAT family N-acetyltransferase n=1 Tax=Hyphomonas sp. TaxID=87 RepID=UPI0025C617C3|nr:GNAT family N-acetyltransferase [Hyphomonas sp.]
MCNTPLQVSLDIGHDVLLRPVGLEDEPRFRKIFEQMSPESRYLRFFSGANPVPDAVVHTLADADGDRHIAWGILNSNAEGQPLMAAAHAIRSEPGSSRAELALGVLDQYQAHGLSRLLIASVALSCRACGITTLEAETLPENRKANHLFKALGGKVIRPMPPTTLWEFDVAQLIETLRTMDRPEGLRKVFAVNADEAA